MKKQFLISAVSMLILLFSSLSSAKAEQLWTGKSTQWTQGSGTEADPYLLETPAHLSYLSKQVANAVATYENTYFRMTDDFDMNSAQQLIFTPIGKEPANPFKGHFDGAGHKVSNLMITYANNLQYCAMFGCTDGASISNLTIDNITYGNTGTITFASTLVAYMKGGSLASCKASGSLEASGIYCGGLVAFSEGEVTIDKCVNEAAITFNANNVDASVGGIVGYKRAGAILQISNSHNEGTIVFNQVDDSGRANYVSGIGGLVGTTTYELQLLKSYNTGDLLVDVKHNYSSQYTYTTGTSGYVVNIGRGSSTRPITSTVSSYTLYYYSILNVGGAIGYICKNDTATATALSLSQCSNTGNIEVTNSGTYGNVESNTAGLVGKCDATNSMQSSIMSSYVHCNISVPTQKDPTPKSSIPARRSISRDVKFDRSEIDYIDANNVSGRKKLSVLPAIGGHIGDATTSTVSVVSSTTYHYVAGFLAEKTGEFAIKLENSYYAGLLSGQKIDGISTATINDYSNNYYLSSCGATTESTFAAALDTATMTSYSLPMALNNDGDDIFVYDENNDNGGFPLFEYQATPVVPAFTVSLSCDSEQGTVTGGGTFDEGTQVQISATPADGYQFKQWSDGVTDNPRTLTLTQDMTLTAEFEPIMFNVAVSSADESMGTVSGSGEFAYGTAVQLTATPAEGYQFVSWSDGSTDNPRTLTLTQDLTLTAEFEKIFVPGSFIEDAIEFDLVNGHSLSKNSTTWYKIDLSVLGNNAYNLNLLVNNVQTPLQAGKVRIEYYAQIPLDLLNVDGSLMLRDSTNIPGGSMWEKKLGWEYIMGLEALYLKVETEVDALVFAELESVIIYKLTLSCESSLGTVSGDGTFEEGTQVEITATPAEGYKFTQWSDGNTDNPRTIVLIQDTTLVAEFEPIMFNVAVSSADESMGTVSGSGEFAYGTAVQLTATPAEGYQFKQWSDGNTDNPRTIVLTQDTTLTAEFELVPITYKVSGKSNNSSMGYVSGTGTYNEGTEVKITAVARFGNIFTQWSDGETVNPRTFILTQDTTFTAYFESHCPAASGTCGNGVTWEISCDRKLIVGGKGEIESSPWRQYSSYFDTLIISDGVTKICNNAFDNCSYLVSVTLGQDLKEIGRYAFNNCNKLTAITIPHNVATIADYCFKGCSNLKDITFQSVTVPTISKTFVPSIKNCNYYVPCGTKNKYNVALRSNALDFTLLTKIFERPAYICNVRSADEEMGEARVVQDAADCGGAITIQAFPKEGYVFSYWNHKPAFILDNSAKNPRYLYTDSVQDGLHIYNYVAYFEKAKVVSVLSNDESMGTTSGRMYVADSTKVDISASALEGYYFSKWSDGNTDNPRTILVTQDTTFTAVFKPGCVIALGNCGTKEDGNTGDNLIWELSCDSVMTISGTGEMDLYLSGAPWKDSIKVISTLNVEDGVTSIGRGSFAYATNLREVNIGKTVRTIGALTFQNCTGLTSVTMPDSIKGFGAGAFEGCTNLKAMHITDLARWSWITMSQYVNYVKSSTPLYYAHHLYLNGEEIKDLVLPDTLTHVAAYAFDGGSAFTSLTIPATMRSIGAYAFRDCSSLTSITCEAVIPPSLGSYVFQNVSRDIPLYVPAGTVEAYKTASTWREFKVKCIAAYGTCGAEGDNLIWELDCDGVLTISGTGKMEVFTSAPWQEHADDIKRVVIEEGVTSITNNAMFNLTNLNSLSISASVSQIETLSIINCINLQSIKVNSANTTYDSRNNCNAIIATATNKLVVGCTKTDIPATVTWIGENAFRGSGLQKVVIPEQVTQIDQYAFSECSNLISVKIPASVTGMEDLVFYSCPKLTAVTFKGITPPALINTTTFCGWFNSTDCDVYVPCGTKEVYYLTINNKKDKNSINTNKKRIEGLPEIPYSCFYSFSEEKIHEKVVNDYNITSKASITSMAPQYSYLTIPSSITILQEPTCEDRTLIFSADIPDNLLYGEYIQFTQWSDGVTDNPRTLILTQDTTLTALFRGVDFNVNVVSSDESLGTVSGSGIYEVGTTVQISATPIGENTFVQWSDSVTDNPRTFTLLQDTTFTAIFYKCKIAYGYCGAEGDNGNNLTWELSCDSVLTISGIGEMADYSSYSSVPWYSYSSSIKSVIINDGVTSIGKSAFFDCSNLTSVTFPNSVTSIESFAFVGCSSLTSIEIPMGVNYIGEYSFSGCSSLSEVHFAGVNPPEIHIGAFAGISSDCKFIVPCGSRERYIEALNMYTYGETDSISASRIIELSYIASGICGAEGDGTNVRWAIGCDSVLTISGTGAMAGWTMDEWCQKVYAATYVDFASPFYDYKDLISSIVIEEGVTNIGGVSIWGNAGTVVIPSTVKSIDDGAFMYCGEIDSIFIPASVERIGKAALMGLFVGQIRSVRFESEVPPVFDNDTVYLGTYSGNSSMNRPYPAFYGSSCLIYVPCGCKQAYLEAINRNLSNNYISEDRIIEMEGSSNNLNYSISAASAYQGSVTIKSEEQFCNTTVVTFRADAADGYVFKQWSDGISENPRTLTLTQDTTLTAEFEPLMYVVAVLSEDESMGIVSGSGEYAYNTAVQITATPAEGYQFKQWSDGNADNPRTLTLAQDITLTAEFEPLVYVVTVLSEDELRGVVSGSGEYDYNTAIQIAATPVEGYQFKQWSDGISENPRTLTLTQDTTLTAEFEDIWSHLSVESADSEQGTVSGSGRFEPGSTVTIIAEPTDLFVFDYWTNGTEKFYEQELSLTLTQDTAFVAHFKPWTVNVVAEVHNDNIDNFVHYYTPSFVSCYNDNCYEFYRFKNVPVVKKNDEYTIELTDAQIFEMRKALTDSLHMSYCQSEEYVYVDSLEREVRLTNIYDLDIPRFSYSDKQTLTEITISMSTEHEIWSVTIETNDDLMGYVIASYDSYYDGEIISEEQSYDTRYDKEEYVDIPCGTDVKYTAIPYEGYRFVHWVGLWGDIENQSEFEAEVTYTVRNRAIFEPIEMSAELEMIYVNGTPIENFAPSTYNYTFHYPATTADSELPTVADISWKTADAYQTVSALQAGNSVVLSVTSGRGLTKAYVLSFNIDRYEQFVVTTLSNNEEWGIVIGGNTYNANSQVDIGAFAKDGYQFYNWNNHITDNPYSFTLTQDTAFVALFLPDNTEEMISYYGCNSILFEWERRPFGQGYWIYVYLDSDHKHWLCKMKFNFLGVCENFVWGPAHNHAYKRKVSEETESNRMRLRARAAQAEADDLLTYELTGLAEDTEHFFVLETVDANDEVVEAMAGTVRTMPQVVTELEQQSAETAQPRKVVKDGHVYILMPDGRMYDATGRQAE